MNKLLVTLLAAAAAAAMTSGCNRGPDPCTPSSLAVIAREDGIDRARAEVRAICEKVGFEDCSEVRKDLVELLSCYYYLTE